MQYDVVIIGGGIVGLSSAFNLLELQKNLKVCVLEKEGEVAHHQTSRNSGVIHSGIYYQPNGSKAVNCRRGYEMLLAFCQKYGVRYDLCGKVIVAVDDTETMRLRGIFERGIANGLTGIRMLTRAELKEKEPYAEGVAAIWVPEAGIISYAEVAQKYAEIIQANGGEVLCNRKVTEIHERADGVTINTAQGAAVRTKLVVTCAGLYADKVAKMTQSSLDFQIFPFRGEYYELKKESEYLVNGLIYPVPDPNFPFLGVHFTKMIQGGVEAGPNAVFAFKREGYGKLDFDAQEFWEAISHKGFQKVAIKHWKTELYEIYRSFSRRAFLKALQRLVPSISADDIAAGRAGVRAQAIDGQGVLLDEFMTTSSHRTINLCNAPSPAATSSLSIGATVAGKALAQLGGL